MQTNELGSRILRRLGALVTALCAAVAVALVLAPAPALASNQETTLTIPVSFEVEGDKAATTPTYTAELAAIGDAPMPADGVTTVSSVGAGSAEFGEITYTTPGVYRYTVTQTTGAMDDWTLDSTVYYVKVTCSWEQGVFKRTVAAYTTPNESGYKADACTFINSYKEPVVPSTPSNNNGTSRRRLTQTGDTTSMMAIGALLAVGVVVVCAGLWLRRRAARRAL